MPGFVGKKVLHLAHIIEAFFNFLTGIGGVILFQMLKNIQVGNEVVFGREKRVTGNRKQELSALGWFRL